MANSRDTEINTAETPEINAAEEERSHDTLTRRSFMFGAALLGAGAVGGGALTGAFLANEDTTSWQTSNGYLLIDSKKCAGCRTCMLTCSMVHSGTMSFPLARIQVRSNALSTFPDDIAQRQCHQCPYPGCVAACPTEAMHIDEETGVRTVDERKCIGCERCIEGCPYTPSRVQWNPIELHAQKCDLCLDTPYWNQEGGAGGKQACVSVCPMQAIVYTSDVPRQGSEGGYDVNLRNQHYLSLGLPNDDEAKIVPSSTY